MRLLLSICLLLASVVAARAQALTWDTPGSPMHGEALLGGSAAGQAQAERPTPPEQTLRLSAALAWTITGDDGGGPLVWMTGAPAPDEQTSGFRTVSPADMRVRDDAPPRDDRRAIRAFKRTLLPPDIA